MEKIKTFILDDEALSIDALIWDLEHSFPEVEVIGKSTTPLSALEEVRELEIDLLILDIDMPELNGFQFLEQLGDLGHTQVVFVTAHNEFAIQAFEVNAIDYVLKPSSIEDLKRVFQKVLSAREAMNFQDLFQYIKSNNIDTENLRVTTSEGMEIISLKEIIYCKADSNYSYIFKSDGKKVSISKPLKFIEEKLDPRIFLRVHQSYLVNTSYVRKVVSKGDSCIVLSDDTSIPVSRSFKPIVQEYFS